MAWLGDWWGGKGSGGISAPGPARGVLSWLRQLGSAWPGPALGRRTEAGEEVTRERARSGPQGVQLPWFLPYFDAGQSVGETAQMRRAYRLMLADPYVRSAFLGKLLAVGALDLKIHPADKKNPNDKRVAEYVEWALTRRLKGGVPGLVWSVLSGGLMDGYSVSEKVWRLQDKGRHAGHYVLGDLKPKDTGDDVVLVTDEYRNVTGVMGLRYNGGDTFAPANFLLFRNLPLFDTPTGMSDFRAAYKAYWMIDTVQKLRMRHLDKRAEPITIGHYKTPTVMDSLGKALALLRSQTWTMVPEEARVEALDMAGSAADIYKSALEDLKHEVFLALQGAILQALEGTVADGRGNSQVHRSTADLFVWYLSAALESLLNDEESGLIRDMVDLNFVVSEYPHATLSAVDVNELLQEKDIDQALHQAGLDLSKEELYDRYGRTPPRDDSDKLPGQQGGSPPEGEGGGGGSPFGGDASVSALTPGPKEAAEAKPATDDFAEQPFDCYAATPGFTGEKKDKIGRRICYVSGKRVACPKRTPAPKPARTPRPPAAPRAARPGKPTVDDVHALIQAAKAKGPTHQDLQDIATQMGQLTVAQLGELKKKLPVKASGNKADLIDKIKTRAFAGTPVTATAAPAATATPVVPPTPAPTPVPPAPPSAGAIYAATMATLATGRNLDPAARAVVSQHLGGMTHAQLQGLYHALGGTNNSIRWGSQRVLEGGVLRLLAVPTPPAPPTPAPPTPAPATVPTPTAGLFPPGSNLARAHDRLKAVEASVAGTGNLRPGQALNRADDILGGLQPAERKEFLQKLGIGRPSMGHWSGDLASHLMNLAHTPGAARPTPAAAPPAQPPPASPPSPLHRGANVITGKPAAGSVIPSKAEQVWTTGKPEPGTLNGIPFTSAPPKFWEKVKDVDVGEPPPVSRIARAGVMIQEPDGRIWIVQPTNEYGRRKHTLPGGGVEPGLSDQQNALKEVWEETGLQVEITGYAGDFEDSNTQKNGRLYFGKRVGGAPWDAKIESHIISRKTGKPAAESETVTLVTPERAAQLLHRSDDLAQLAVVRPIPVNTPTTGKGSEPLKKLVAAIAPVAEQYKKNHSRGNGELYAVQQLRGFNGKPTVVSKKDMDSLLAGGGHIEMTRGLSSFFGKNGQVTAQQMADQFKTGENFPGHGMFGSGTYADSTQGSENVTAKGRYGNGGAVVRMALPKNAKIIKESELAAKVPKNPDLFKKYFGGHKAEECWRGVQAALAGYDAIYVDDPGGRKRYGRGYYVVLNRSILVVQKEDATGHVVGT